MKTLKINFSTFVIYLMASFLPMFFLIVIFFEGAYHYGFQLKLFICIPAILGFAYYPFLVTNYFLYDKNTVIEIDENGNITYSNIQQTHFHIQDICSCTELASIRFGIGYTEVALKNGFVFYVSNLISLDAIYKMNPDIKREKNFFFLPKILRHGKL